MRESDFLQNMEIERKFLVKEVPDLDDVHYEEFIQGYLNRDPVVRVRQEGERYFLTYKGKGLMAREEHNLPLDEKSFEHLIFKCDGKIISKTRYYIPLEGSDLIAELDIFNEPHEGLMLVEVEFLSMGEAEYFTPPAWFGEEVTDDPAYHNSNLSLQEP